MTSGEESCMVGSLIVCMGKVEVWHVVSANSLLRGY